jgi:hypothetical protein
MAQADANPMRRSTFSAEPLSGLTSKSAIWMRKSSRERRRGVLVYGAPVLVPAPPEAEQGVQSYAPTWRTQLKS